MSLVWQYFTKSSATEAICSVCLKQFKTGGGTTNLRAHLRYKHPSITFDEKCDVKNPTIVESYSSDEKVVTINALDPLDSMVPENQAEAIVETKKRKFGKLKQSRFDQPESVYIRASKNNAIGPYLGGIDDQFDTIGKNVAFKLRSLTPEIALVAEKLISDILYESAMGNISKHSRINIFDSNTDPLN